MDHNVIEELPTLPHGDSHFVLWSTWASEQLKSSRIPVLRHPCHEEDRERGERLVMAWRALVASWAGSRTVAPDDAVAAAADFFRKAGSAPPYIVRAAYLITDLAMEDGVSSPDILYYVATFAWPLRDVMPEFSEICWQYLIYAPWQVEAQTFVELFRAAAALDTLADGRSVLDLVHEHLSAGQPDSAMEVLEAVAMIHSGVSPLGRLVKARDFRKNTVKVPDSDRLLSMLAQMYKERGNDQVHARAIMEYVAQQDTNATELMQVLQTRVWDQPFDEVLDSVRQMTNPSQLDLAIKRAVAAGQLSHARRIAESAIVHDYRNTFPFQSTTVPQAIANFMSANHLVKQRPISRRAAEHLAPLYVQTDFSAGYARDFIFHLVKLPFFVGKGTPLHAVQDDLTYFAVTSDPFRILAEENTQLMNLPLSGSQEAARDDVMSWFSKRFDSGHQGMLDRFMEVITAPMLDLSNMAGDLLGLEQLVESSFRMLLKTSARFGGEVESLRASGRELTSQHGVGTELIAFAREQTRLDLGIATGSSFALGLLPPGVSIVARTADLATTLLLAGRAINRVAAIFGKPGINEPEGLQFVLDSFAMGCSSKNGDGLIAYLQRGDRGALSSFAIGGVAYGGTSLAKHLWTAPGADGRAVAEVAIENIARLCGFQLQQGFAGRLVPVAGAIFASISTYAMVHEIVDAAIHVAARDTMLAKQLPAL